MKRKSFISIIATIAILMVFVIIGSLQLDNKEEIIPQNEGEQNFPQLDLTNVNTAYQGDIDVDVKSQSVTGKLFVTTINDTGKDQDVIYFHIYPNSFRDLSKLNDPNWREILGGNPKPGWMDINSVKVDQQSANYIVDGSILKIPLTEWKQNEKIDLEIDFKLKVPQDNATLSYDNHAIRFGNWLPSRAVYDEEGWDLHPYYPIGDPFYSDVANYNINLTIPKGYQVASSGIDKQPINVSSDKQTFAIIANRMRDFAMVVMDSQYEPKVSNLGEITVRTWHFKGDPASNINTLHHVSTSSLEYFSKHYGDYPYKEYDVVRTGGFYGGMEFPGLVYIQGTVFEGNYQPGVLYIAHETAHQWWYSLVGNDEVEHPWLDESLAQYSTLRYMYEQFRDYYNGYYGSLENQVNMSRVYEANNEFISNPVTEFSSWSSYGNLVYGKGPIMFMHLQNTVGPEKMDEVLQNIFKNYQYRNVRPEEFINEFKNVLGQDVETYFNTWLHKGTVDYIAK